MVTTSYKWQAGATPLTQTNDTLTAGNQSHPALAGNSSGTAFLAAWTDPIGNYSVEDRLMLADGTALGSQFMANTTSAGGQFGPSVAGLIDGRFVEVFIDTGTDPGGDLRARFFNADGSPAGNDFVINNQPSDDDEADVAALSDGGFVVSWTRSFGGGDYDIRTSIFNADGSIRASTIQTTIAQTAEEQASVAALAGGNFVVAWQKNPAGGGNSEVYFRRYAADGTVLDPGASGVLIDGTGTVNNDIQVVGLPDGGFAVAYTDNGWGLNGTEITARVFNADGSARSAFLLVNGSGNGGKTTGDQDHPSLTVLANGDFVVGWHSTSNLEYLQAYDAQGHALGSNAIVQGNVLTAEIAGLGGRVAMLAESLIPDGSGGSIRSKVYELVRTLDGDNSSEVIHATEDGLKETINGAGGDDTAVFSHNLNDYTLEDFGAKILVFGPNGSTPLTSIEHLQFADTTLTPFDDGNPLFDTLYYLSRNADVFHAGVNALDHFNANGWHEGRDPNALFSVNQYLGANPDVKASGMNPLDHYHQIGWHQGRDPSANFDTTLYLVHNPDVAAAGVDPLAHFLSNGFAEGRHAYAAIGTAVNGFDAEYYLFHNPDVAAAGVDPFAHFNANGWHEGRNPNAWFDTNGYLAHYADVAAAGMNPLAHYEQFGWQEGRDPSAGFDTNGYLAANPDVAAAHINPLDHFINNGIYEGRAAVNDGLWH